MAIMTKRTSPSPAAAARQTVKLLSVQNGERVDYLEPSVVCAAQHALAILDLEEGSTHAIEVNGQPLWSYDRKDPRASLAKLEELAVGDCVR
jgi:hypothetical protein